MGNNNSPHELTTAYDEVSYFRNFCITYYDVESTLHGFYLFNTTTTTAMISSLIAYNNLSPLSRVMFFGYFSGPFYEFGWYFAP